MLNILQYIIINYNKRWGNNKWQTYFIVKSVKG